MLPKEIARQHYESEPQALSWDELIDLYSSGAADRVLIDTDDLFLLGKPVRWADKAGIAVDKAFARWECDTWFVWMYVGQLCNIYPLIPFPLPFVAWRKINNGLRFYAFDRLTPLIKKSYEGCSKYPRSAQPCA